MDAGARSHFRRLQALSAVSRGRSNEQRRDRGSFLPMLLAEVGRPCATCQWIDGEPTRRALRCGAPSIAGKSWCGDHYWRVFTPRNA